MAQTTVLIQTLKKALKAHGKTYADVAEHLQLTEASVKRLFSEQSFSLRRLDQACQMMDLEISDLFNMMGERQEARLQQLSNEQEKELAEDSKRVLAAVCVLNGWGFDDILSRYDINETNLIQHLARLDKLRIIELLPKNRIKLLVAPNFHWRPDGPIQRFFQAQVQQYYFDSRFSRKGERLLVLNGMLSESSVALFQRKMERLAREFDELSADDRGLPLQQKRGVTAVLAARDWDFNLTGQ